eukprot:4288653-Lingulodinium_polyedra.AAC.1
MAAVCTHGHAQCLPRQSGPPRHAPRLAKGRHAAHPHQSGPPSAPSRRSQGLLGQRSVSHRRRPQRRPRFPRPRPPHEAPVPSCGRRHRGRPGSQ